MQEFREAVERNDVDGVKKYLKIIDPSDDDNWAIRYASARGHLEMVQLLLSDSRVNPSADDNFSIRFASENGYLEIVRLLLDDKRVDPNAENNWAIGWASARGHVEVVRLLLSDPRVDPNAENNWAICWASKYGHLEVVRLLLQDSRVDPSDGNNYSIYEASCFGHIEVVRLLLQDPRVDFNAICYASEMKTLLLKEERNKLREEFTFKYQVIQKSSPQILIEGKQKSKIPSVLLRKIVYDASHQERSTSIRLLALASLNIG